MEHHREDLIRQRELLSATANREKIDQEIADRKEVWDSLDVMSRGYVHLERAASTVTEMSDRLSQSEEGNAIRQGLTTRITRVLSSIIVGRVEIDHTTFPVNFNEKRVFPLDGQTFGDDLSKKAKFSVPFEEDSTIVEGCLIPAHYYENDDTNKHDNSDGKKLTSAPPINKDFLDALNEYHKQAKDLQDEIEKDQENTKKKIKNIIFMTILQKYYKNKIHNFFKSMISTIFKGFILLIHYFSYTPFYVLYILMIILGFFCSVKESYMSVISSTFICVLLFFTLFFIVILNLQITCKKIEHLLGKPFLDLYLPGHFKGLYSLLLFVVTISILDLMEASSLYMKTCEFQDSLDLTNKKIESLTVNHMSISNMSVEANINDLLLKIGNLPAAGYPKTGFLTDLSSRLCIF